MTPIAELGEGPWNGDHTLEVRVFRCPDRRSWPTHRHAEHEVLWCSGGVVTVDVGNRRWRLTAGSLLFVPGQQPHEVAGWPGATFSCVFLRPTADVGWPAPTRIVTTPMLAEILRYLARDDITDAARQHAESVVFDVLQPTPTDGSVPLPADARARAVAERLVADPADGRSLDQWGRCVGASARTLSRLFQDQLGMTFQDWRTSLRVQVACGLLAREGSVGDVASAVGFATPSAFTECFRRIVGMTPREYQRANRRH